MTNIVKLIEHLYDLPSLESLTKSEAEQFLDKLEYSDQCALISAMYVGRDHIHDEKFRDDYSANLAFGRYEVTGNHPEKGVPQKDFSRILAQKSQNLRLYFDSFLRCAENSPSFKLNNF